MTTPIAHVKLSVYDLKYSPRPICKYMQKKNNEAPLAWVIRVSHPIFTSRIICSIQSKAISVFEE